MLLTSSQVSMALSSTIVFFFTLALFLAGYVLQQQTVRSLEHVIKPRLPSPHANSAQHTQTIVDPRSKSSRNLFNLRHGSLHSVLAKKEQLVDVNWNKLAYVQIVKSHEEVCSAVMVLGELYRTKSPAQRVLLFPKHWAFDKVDEESGDSKMDERIYTTRRLLRKAARRFSATLVPIGTMQSEMDVIETSPESYSMAPAFSLIDYDRMILLPPPGVLLNAMPLDSFLAFSEPTAAVTALTSQDSNSDILESPILIQPSRADYTHLTTLLKQSESPVSDTSLLTKNFPSIPSISSNFDSESLLFTTTSTLTRYPANPGPAHQFNATDYLAHTSFIRLQDDGLPGPEYDIPYAVRAEARPKNEAARKVWERVYDNFRARRQDVCGLELEVWENRGASGGEESRGRELK